MRPEPLGSWAERLAAEHLRGNGWTIRGRNYRVGHKEVDLIAERDGVVAFVEVKARSAGAFGHPLEAVTWRKRRQIEQVASQWIQGYGRPGLTYRFDAIAVTREAGGGPAFQHLENAWRLDGA